MTVRWFRFRKARFALGGAALLLALIALLLPVSACAAAALPWRLKSVEQAAEGEVLVNGAITFFKDGAEKKCDDGGAPCIIIILPPEGQKASVFEFKKSTEFTLSLPPGSYTVLAFGRMYAGWDVVPVQAAFSVPADARAVYIGDLLMVMQKGRYLAGVRDDYDEALVKFNTVHPAMQGALVRGVVKQILDPGTWKSMLYVCAEAWKLACPKHQEGVAALLPPNSKRYDVVGDLRPVFSWSASADPAVTYDIAVYEAASFNNDIFSRQYVMGRLAAYREALTMPTWQPDQPLGADRRYFWSIRLRRGDLVSNWSTYSYFNFFIIGFSSGYGQWFRFATPPAPKPAP